MGILSGRRLLDSESSKKNVIYSRTIILVCCLCTVISGIIFLVVAGNKTDDTFLSVRTGVAVSDNSMDVCIERMAHESVKNVMTICRDLASNIMGGKTSSPSLQYSIYPYTIHKTQCKILFVSQ